MGMNCSYSRSFALQQSPREKRSGFRQQAPIRRLTRLIHAC